MHGEPLFYDVAMLCDQALLDLHELRSAARRTQADGK